MESKSLRRHLMEEHGVVTDRARYLPSPLMVELHADLHAGDPALNVQTVIDVDDEGRRSSPVLVTPAHLHGHPNNLLVKEGQIGNELDDFDVQSDPTTEYAVLGHSCGWERIYDNGGTPSLGVLVRDAREHLTDEHKEH